MLSLALGLIIGGLALTALAFMGCCGACCKFKCFLWLVSIICILLSLKKPPAILNSRILISRFQLVCSLIIFPRNFFTNYKGMSRLSHDDIIVSLVLLATLMYLHVYINNTAVVFVMTVRRCHSGSLRGWMRCSWSSLRQTWLGMCTALQWFHG